MLAKGEVAEVIVRPDIDIVTIVLHEGAVIKGRRMTHRTFHMNIVDTNKFEEKLRAAEQRLGIPLGKGVPIVYERNADTAGRLLSTLIAAAILISIVSRMKGFKSPISMNSFVRTVEISRTPTLIPINLIFLQFRPKWEEPSSH